MKRLKWMAILALACFIAVGLVSCDKDDKKDDPTEEIGGNGGNGEGGAVTVRGTFNFSDQLVNLTNGDWFTYEMSGVKYAQFAFFTFDIRAAANSGDDSKFPDKFSCVIIEIRDIPELNKIPEGTFDINHYRISAIVGFDIRTDSKVDYALNFIGNVSGNSQPLTVSVKDGVATVDIQQVDMVDSDTEYIYYAKFHWKGHISWDENGKVIWP